MPPIDKLRFLNPEQVRDLAEKFGTPIYVYDENSLIERAGEVLGFKAPFGLTARYAMKASPNVNILRLFSSMGIKIDASSGYEALRAIRAGIAPAEILLTAQERPDNLEELVSLGVKLDACNFMQLESYGKLLKGKAIGLRINPGMGSGGTNRTNTGGPASSFGIWHEYIERAKETASRYDLTIERVHTHIGSGSDPEIWARVSSMSIALLDSFPEASVLNLGGGFKVARMEYEKGIDLQSIADRVSADLQDYHKRTGRKIRLEIEPGTYYLANSGAIIARVDAVSDTGSGGYKYYIVNSGLTELARPALYGAQHPVITVSKSDLPSGKREEEEVIVAGHCCESGDILTPEIGDPEGLKPRRLERAEPGDYIVVEGCGAYCSAMPLKNYNSFPEAAEVLIRKTGEASLIRKRQSLEQIVQNELTIS